MTVLAAATLFAGCSKDGRTVTLGARIDTGSDVSKVYLNGNTPCWHNGDMLYINNDFYPITGASGNAAQIFDVLESEDGYRAIFPASLVPNEDEDITYTSSVDIVLPAVQEYRVVNGRQRVDVPMAAYITSGTTLAFHNLCSVVRVNVENTLDNPLVLDHIVLSAATASLSGSGTATILGTANDAITMNSTGGSHDVTLFIAGRAEVAAHQSMSFDVVCPAFNTDNITISVYTPSKYASLEKEGVSLQGNNINTVTMQVNQLTDIPVADAIEGSLSGLFSVGINHRVRFSKGNLQWSASGSHNTLDGSALGTWRFAGNQYDIVGSPSFYENEDYSEYYNYDWTCPGNVYNGDNALISDSCNGWIDLFGFGTSGCTLINPYESSDVRHRDPWLTSMDPNDYFTPYSDISRTESDWGYYNAISNGGNTPGLWRTLSTDEWHYLLYERTGASNKVSFGCITVGDNRIYGLILLPDEFTQPAGVDFTPGIDEDESVPFTFNNIYSTSQWAQMEAAGAVFLPGAGEREYDYYYDENGNPIPFNVFYSVGYWGQYWTSTTYGDYDSESWCLYFGYYEEDSSIDPPNISNFDKKMGSSIRLVQNM